jgi:hypothetical protein
MNMLVRSLRSVCAGALLLTGLALIDASAPPYAGTVAEARSGQSILTLKNVCDWDRLDWSEMTAAERQAWSVLGMNADNWNSGATTTTKPVVWDESNKLPAAKDWEELTIVQKGAAMQLGYGEYSWDYDCK